MDSERPGGVACTASAMCVFLQRVEEIACIKHKLVSILEEKAKALEAQLSEKIKTLSRSRHLILQT